MLALCILFVKSRLSVSLSLSLSLSNTRSASKSIPISIYLFRLLCDSNVPNCVFQIEWNWMWVRLLWTSFCYSPFQSMNTIIPFCYIQSKKNKFEQHPMTKSSESCSPALPSPPPYHQIENAYQIYILTYLHFIIIIIIIWCLWIWVVMRTENRLVFFSKLSHFA